MTPDAAGNAIINRGTASSGSAVEQIMRLLLLPEQVRQLQELLAQISNLHESHRKSMDQAVQKLATLEQHDQAFARQIDTLAAENARLGRGMEALCKQQALLEDASARERVLSEQFFEERVIEPLARWCVPIIDLIDEMRQSQGGISSATTTLDAVRAQLLELLAIYAIEPCASSEGCTFDPKLMRPLANEPTGNPELDKKIARSLRVGWRRGERLLRQECVHLYRYQPAIPNKDPQGE